MSAQRVECHIASPQAAVARMARGKGVFCADPLFGRRTSSRLRSINTKINIESSAKKSADNWQKSLPFTYLIHCPHFVNVLREFISNLFYIRRQSNLELINTFKFYIVYVFVELQGQKEDDRLPLPLSVPVTLWSPTVTYFKYTTFKLGTFFTKPCS